MKKHTHIKGNTQQKMREKKGERDKERQCRERKNEKRERERD